MAMFEFSRIDHRDQHWTHCECVLCRGREAERRMPPLAQGTVKLLRDRGHCVAVRAISSGSLRYRLDGERERTAFELSNRLRRLHGVG
jgi:hypothetical protein